MHELNKIKEKIVYSSDHLYKRSKNDLVEMIKVLIAENPTAVSVINSREQRKAAGRIVSIQALQRALARAYRNLATKHADVEELLMKFPEQERKQWIENKKKGKVTV